MISTKPYWGKRHTGGVTTSTSRWQVSILPNFEVPTCYGLVVPKLVVEAGQPCECIVTLCLASPANGSSRGHLLNALLWRSAL